MRHPLTLELRAALLQRCARLVKARQRAGERPRHRGDVRVEGSFHGIGYVSMFKTVFAALESSGCVVVTDVYTGATLAVSMPGAHEVLDESTDYTEGDYA